jgi:hypothetical protein
MQPVDEQDCLPSLANMNRHPFRAAILKPQISQNMIPGFIVVSGFHTIDSSPADMQKRSNPPKSFQQHPFAIGFLEIVIGFMLERIIWFPGRLSFRRPQPKIRFIPDG